jgi:hypothetical protein
MTTAVARTMREKEGEGERRGDHGDDDTTGEGREGRTRRRHPQPHEQLLVGWTTMPRTTTMG